MRTLLAALFLVACGRTPPPGPRAQLAPAGVPAAPETAVDALLHASWKQAGVTPAPPASDAEWLRRVTLDLAGRVPTADEARAFLASTAADRRAALVDRLLASEDHAEHMADVYSDLLLGRDLRVRFARRELVSAPRAWLAAAFRENRPYDRIVSELLAAEGDVTENGAAAFVAFHLFKGGGGPDGLAAATARDFLGLSIQCAQCHDHPYDARWKQADFRAFSAWFAHTAARPRKPADDQERSIEVIEARNARQQRRLARALEQRNLAVNDDAPRFLGADAGPADGETRRQALARAIVASPRFSRVTVNRLWRQLLGRALVEPWDDLGDEREHPALLVRLAGDFTASKHDHRALLRAIVLSDAYARSSRGATDEAEQVFARAAVRPLSADQRFRSLLAVTGIEQIGRGRFRAQIADGKARALREYLFVFEDDDGAERDGFQGSVTQALLLWNGELTNLGARALDGGALVAILAATDDDAARLDELFLRTLSRRPSDAERARLLPAMKARADWEDLLFALLTSTEFVTNH